MAKEEVNAALRVTVARCKEIIGWRGIDGGYDAIAWCCDAPPYKRLEIRSDYKANRQKPDPRAADQCRRIEQWLRDQGELVWSCVGWEADDLQATAVAQAPENVEAIDLLTGDKDLLQLVSERVNVLPTQRNSPVSRYDVHEVRERYGITPAQFADYLALVGDTSDNIPGAKGIGPKKATDLLNRVGPLGEIMKAAQDVADKRIPVSVRQLLNNSFREIADSRRLVTLMTDAPIRFEELFEERERMQLEPPPEDSDEAPEADEDAPPDDDEAPPELGGKEPAQASPPVANSEDAEPTAKEPEPEPADEAPKSETRQAAPEPEQEPAAKTEAKPNGAAPCATGSPGGTGGAGGTGGTGDNPPDEGDDAQRPAAQTAKLPAVSDRAEFALTYEPNSRKVAWWLADKAAQSGVFPGIKNAAQGYIVLQLGREMGLTAMASMRGIKMVNGQPMIMATLLVGIILRSGLAEYFECRETTSTRAVYATKRKGRPREQTLEYTIEEAKAADLTKPSRNGEPSNYIKRPKTMLRHRAAAELARMVYPEIASGVYVFGEDMGDGIETIDAMGVEIAS